MLNDQNVLFLKQNPKASSIDNLLGRLYAFGYDIHMEENELSETSLLKICLIELNPEELKSNLLEEINALRLKYPDVYVIATYTSRLKYSVEEVIAADVNEVFHYPFDEESIIDRFLEHCPVDLGESDLNLSMMDKVSLEIFEKEDPAPVNMYVCLPANEKVILYMPEGAKGFDVVEEKLKKNNKFQLYIRKSDNSKFLDYTYKEGKSDHFEDGLKTKNKNFNQKLSRLVSRLFTTDKTEKDDVLHIVENVDEIIDYLMRKLDSSKPMMDFIEKLAGRPMNSYNHSKNVSIYCMIFGKVVGFNESEVLRIGGLLHDVGMSELPSRYWQMGGLNFEQILGRSISHSELGIELIESNKLELPEEVMLMISQHHEHPDGSGLPFALKSEEIHPYAKICGLADVFDELTSVRDGHPTLSPKDALRFISGESGSSAHPIYDPYFHGPIIKFFLDDELSISNVLIEDKSSAKQSAALQEFELLQKSQKKNFTYEDQDKLIGKTESTLASSSANHALDLLDDLDQFDDLATNATTSAPNVESNGESLEAKQSIPEVDDVVNEINKLKELVEDDDDLQDELEEEYEVESSGNELDEEEDDENLDDLFEDDDALDSSGAKTEEQKKMEYVISQLMSDD